MHVVRKFTLDPDARAQEFECPLYPHFISLQIYDGAPTLWALITADTESNMRLTARIFETGELIPESALRSCYFAGTFQMMNSAGETVVKHVIVDD